jgi:hypothetical protein
MITLIATDAWYPQINGVVRTLQSLAERLRTLGATPEFLTPEGFPSVPIPTYPELRFALTSRREIAHRIDSIRPDAIHIATEGPVGLATRHYCLAASCRSQQALPRDLRSTYRHASQCRLRGVTPHCAGSTRRLLRQ